MWQARYLALWVFRTFWLFMPILSDKISNPFSKHLFFQKRLHWNWTAVALPVCTELRVSAFSTRSVPHLRTRCDSLVIAFLTSRPYAYLGKLNVCVQGYFSLKTECLFLKITISHIGNLIEWMSWFFRPDKTQQAQ